MKKKTISLFLVISFSSWLAITYFLFTHRPSSSLTGNKAVHRLSDRLNHLERRVKEQLLENSILFSKLKDMKSSLENGKRRNEKEVAIGGRTFKKDKEKEDKKSKEDRGSILEVAEAPKGTSGEAAAGGGSAAAKSDEALPAGGDSIGEAPVIALLLFACNRVAVSKAINSLLKHRPSRRQFPLIVSQDCGHAATRQLIKSYGEELIFIQQPDQSDIIVPKKEKKFVGYFKIARHYGWALNETFGRFGYDQAIVLEDDLEVSPDFFSYFLNTLPVLRADPSLMCVSAWNDNGKKTLVDENAVELLHRTDFFPGLGWMLLREFWEELTVKWPRSYWDDWLRAPEQRRGRSCIRPEVSRTITFGRIGVSNGQFFDKHLKHIMLNQKGIDFSKVNLTFLLKENYDPAFDSAVNSARVVSVADLQNGRAKDPKGAPVRVIYHTKDMYKKTAKSLGLMDDFKAGVPRMAYKGVVSFVYQGQRVFLAPNVNWKGYNIKWA